MKKFDWKAFVAGILLILHIISVILIGVFKTLDYSGGMFFGAVSLVIGVIIGCLFISSSNEKHCPLKK